MARRPITWRRNRLLRHHRRHRIVGRNRHCIPRSDFRLKAHQLSGVGQIAWRWRWLGRRSSATGREVDGPWSKLDPCSRLAQ